jgi:hypothetical protein
MAFIRDKILKAWDAAIGRVARKRDDPTDDEIAAAQREVCTKLPGIEPADIVAALRSSVDELTEDVAQKTRLLEELERLAGVHDRLRELIGKSKSGSGEALPGLPGGPPL